MCASVPANLSFAFSFCAGYQQWESLNLSPGMWIRLRRLTITKNRDTCRMLAKMKEGTSSVNPLHPSMAEVQTIAISYARRCASADDDSPTPPAGAVSYTHLTLPTICSV